MSLFSLEDFCSVQIIDAALCFLILSLLCCVFVDLLCFILFTDTMLCSLSIVSGSLVFTSFTYVSRVPLSSLIFIVFFMVFVFASCSAITPFGLLFYLVCEVDLRMSFKISL